MGLTVGSGVVFIVGVYVGKTGFLLAGRWVGDAVVGTLVGANEGFREGDIGLSETGLAVGLMVTGLGVGDRTGTAVGFVVGLTVAGKAFRIHTAAISTGSRSCMVSDVGL